MREIVERMRLFFLCSLLCSAMWSTTCAQTFNVGAVLPLSGSSARTGQVAAAALRASAQTLLGSGIDIEITILDSKSSASYADIQAKALIAAGVHALLCCETAQVAAHVAPSLSAAGVLVLSLAPVVEPNSAQFSLVANDAQVLARLALAPPQPPLALMAPPGADGNLAKDILGGASVGVVRYPAARTSSDQAAPPLTPEALLVATLMPGSVVIWDSAAGTLRAAGALTARGYTGERVVRAEVWRDLDVFGRAELTGAVSVVSPAVLGYRLPDTHPAKAQVSSFHRALRGVIFDSEVETVTVAAASWDAAQLLGAAAEQVLTYAGPTDLTAAAVRSGLRDALIGLGPTTGAGGSYDFSGEGTPGLLADSLVLAVWRGGRFFPYP